MIVIAQTTAVTFVGAMFLVAVLGFIGFFIVVASLMARGVYGFSRAAGRVVGRVLGLRGGRRHDSPSGAPRACPHVRCGHQNPAGARFCARCGRPLTL